MFGICGGVVIERLDSSSGKLLRRLSATTENGPADVGDASSNLSRMMVFGSGGKVLDRLSPIILGLPYPPLDDWALVRRLPKGEVTADAYSGRS